MDKIKKTQIERNQSNKTISDLKKKISELETSNCTLKNKYADMQKKLVKVKDLLRKKEISLTELNAKLE